MKFGKQIAKIAEVTSASLVTEDQWLDYKRLKKLISSLRSEKESQSCASSDNDLVENKGQSNTDSTLSKPQKIEYQKEQLSGNKNEVAFFAKLRYELIKVSRCYREIEMQSYRRVAVLRLHCQKALESDRTDLKKLQDLMKECVDIHLRLLMLENYAVLNYAGFVKILKKHDKVTGFTTKEKFVLNVVNEHPFSVQVSLGKAIKAIETQYTEIKDMSEKARESTIRNLAKNSATASSTLASFTSPLDDYGSLAPPSSKTGFPLATDVNPHKLLLAHHNALLRGDTDWFQNALQRAGVEIPVDASPGTGMKNKPTESTPLDFLGLPYTLEMMALQAQQLVSRQSNESFAALRAKSSSFSDFHPLFTPFVAQNPISDDDTGNFGLNNCNNLRKPTESNNFLKRPIGSLRCSSFDALISAATGDFEKKLASLKTESTKPAKAKKTVSEKTQD